MKLLFLNRKLDFVSTSSYTLDLALALRRLGDEVRVGTLGGPLVDVFRDRGLETYIAKFNLFSFRKLLQFLREYGPEVIHIQNQRGAEFGQRISEKLKVPHVVTVHRLRQGGLLSLAHPLLAGVIAANEVVREALVNDQGISKSLIRVIRHGVNVDALRPEKRAKVAQDHIPVVGCVGRLSRIKGHHVLIEAADIVRRRGVEAMFMIVGDGDEESPLRRQVEAAGLERCVTFSTHIRRRRDLYRIFDIVVVPTLRGGVGAAALEGMAMGKPVIASSVGELLHIVQDRKNGLLVAESDAEALADRICELIEDPKLRAELGKEARRYVRSEFSLERMVEETRVFYKEVRDHMLEQTLP